MMQFLLKSGIDIEARDSSGSTALNYAVRIQKEGIVRLLLENGADTEARDNDRWTPLHCAAWQNNDAIVQLAGANVWAKTEEGWTALDYALLYGFDGIAQVLRKGGQSGLRRSINKCRSVIQHLKRK
jgi:ankyrin repeat protein